MPNQGCGACAVFADWRRLTKLATEGTCETVILRIRKGALSNASAEAGPVSSAPNGIDSRLPDGATSSASTSPSPDATGPSDGGVEVLRGGDVERRRLAVGARLDAGAEFRRPAR